ncbi:MAG: RNA methyltransferase [Verrucomicrobiota bacterium]
MGELLRIEGRHNIEAALAHGFPLSEVIFQNDSHRDLEAALPAALPRQRLSKSAAQAETGIRFHRGVWALAPRPQPRALPTPPPRLIVVAHQLADARNLGALLRNAAALGADQILLSEEGADPYSPPAIRASATAFCRLPIRSTPRLFQELTELRTTHRLLATDLRPDAQEWSDSLLSPVAASPLLLLFGNEGEGLPQEFLALADLRLRLPMTHAMESLNIATTAALLLHDLARLRPRPA